MNRRNFVTALLSLPFISLLTRPAKAEAQLEYYWDNPPKEYHPDYVTTCKHLGISAKEFYKKFSLVETKTSHPTAIITKRFRSLRNDEKFRLFRHDGSRSEWSTAIGDAYPSDINGNIDPDEVSNYGVECASII